MVGILAIQGSVIEHAKILNQLEVDFILVKSLADLEKVTHLIIPGGESTTMTLLLKEYGMWEELEKKSKNKSLKIFGTCAGAILCGHWGLNLKINRNAYGSQIDSFVADLKSDKFPNLRGVFIRAPKFEAVGNNATILAWHEDMPVLVEQDNFLVTTFHPELAGETRIHEYFLKK